MGKTFTAKVKGKLKQLKHYSRHRANARRVSYLRWLEYRKESGIKVSKEDKEIFLTAFNMGYNNGRKRSLALERKSSQN